MTSLGQKETNPATTQVRAVESPQVPPLLLPHYADSGSAFSSPHCSYHSLGHCLRTDIFPGSPMTWTTLVKESYTSHHPSVLPTDRQHWYGRKTDEMVQWTERNIVNHKLQKMLKEMEKKGTAK